MKKTSFLLTLLIAVLAISGCKKDDDSNLKAGLLVGKNWKLTAYTFDGKDALTDTYEPCELDDIETFNANGTYKVDEGATKCDSQDPQISDEGNWKLEGENLIFASEESSLQIKAKVLVLNATTLRYSIINPFGTETLIFTFTAQ